MGNALRVGKRILQVEANPRFWAEGTLAQVITDVNDYLRVNRGREPKEITIGADTLNQQLSIAFILKPKSGEKMWMFTWSKDWETLDMLAAKTTAVVYLGIEAIFLGVK